jgi:hypothetical protein
MNNTEFNNRHNSIFHKIYNILPKNILLKKLRVLFLGLLSPFYFLYYHNHFKTCLKGIAVDRNNEYLPWFSYPLIEILKKLDLSEKKILEFGSGCSTIFFIKKNCHVLSYEEDIDWLEFVKKKCKSEKLEIINRKIDQNDKLKESENKKFDLIVIDGHNREEILKKINDLNLLSDGGAIIFDNSEGYNFSKILNLDENFNHFSKIDFYGHAPGIFRKQASSVIFRSKEKCFLFNRKIKLKNSKEICSPI